MAGPDPTYGAVSISRQRDSINKFVAFQVQSTIQFALATVLVGAIFTFHHAREVIPFLCKCVFARLYFGPYEQELMQVKKLSTPTVVGLEKDVFGDLSGVYKNALASARASKDDGSAWYVPDPSLHLIESRSKVRT